MTTRIKICGMTRPEDALMAAQAGAHALGLVFYEPSPRAVGVEQAARIIEVIPPLVSRVGLFVNADPGYIAEVLSALPLDYLQFHGQETVQDCERFAHPYFKVLHMREHLDLVQCANIYASASALLVDSYVPGIPGGTGQSFDWSRLNVPLSLPLILSGGLTPRNVGQAVAQVRPFAVDVSSGVESAPGVKDAQLVSEFIKGVMHEDLRSA
jgi:phosphoribosylanthranilate isomerase